MNGNGNGVWKVVAIALLSACLSGAGVLVLSAAKPAPVPAGLPPLEQRVAVQETKTAGFEQRLQRMEAKQDQIIELLTRRRP